MEKKATMNLFLFFAFLSVSLPDDLVATTEISFHYSSLKKPSLLLLYTPSCPYCHRVLDYLASIQKSVPLCNVRANRECMAKLMREGKKALVPCLFIGDIPLYDSSAIIEWLQSHQDLLDPLAPLSKGTLGSLD